MTALGIYIIQTAWFPVLHLDKISLPNVILGQRQKNETKCKQKQVNKKHE